MQGGQILILCGLAGLWTAAVAIDLRDRRRNRERTRGRIALEPYGDVVELPVESKSAAGKSQRAEGPVTRPAADAQGMPLTHSGAVDNS